MFIAGLGKVCQNGLVEILDSALKHGIDPDDSVFVVEHPWQCFLMREEPRKVLFLGFSPDGRPLEVIVVETAY